MKKIMTIVAGLALTTSSLSFADSYDPATNLLTVTSITIGATTYTNVVVSVGSVISIGGSSTAASGASCQITLSQGSAVVALQDSQTMRFTITSSSNTLLFAPYYYSIVQGSNSSTLQYSSSYPNDFRFTGDNGWNAGAIPAGVSKSGSIANFPSWFNPHASFSIVNSISGEQSSCVL